MARCLLAGLVALGALIVGAAAAADAPPVDPRAVQLIVRHEIGSEQVYSRRYERPVWPGAASGVTVGVGYDLGHRPASSIVLDWSAHPQHPRMAKASGVIGPPARHLAASMADVVVKFAQARAVFERTSLIEHYRIARRVFGAKHFDQSPAAVQGALVDLVFNRGGSMTGPGRVEMRAIRDDCLPRRDRQCVADQLRAMVRLWKGSSIERGMQRRRFEEAELALAP